MTSSRDLTAALHQAWCGSFAAEVLPDGGIQISTPFLFPDGDGFPIVLERRAGRWRLTDRGVAVSHLQFDQHLLTDARRRLVHRFATASGAALEDNMLLLELSPDLPEAQDIADFIELVARVAGMPLHEASERDGELFKTRATRAIAGWMQPGYDVEANWYAPSDTHEVFPADLRLPAQPTDVVAFFAGSTTKMERSMNSIGQFGRWGESIKPVLAHVGGFNSDTIYRAQEVLGDDSALIEVNEGADQTGYLPLRRILAENGVPVRPT